MPSITEPDEELRFDRIEDVIQDFRTFIFCVEFA